MAYNADNEIKEQLGSVAVGNRGDYIITTKVTNKASGAISADIRRFYTNDAGEILPTQKGVRINSEVLPEVLESLVKVLEIDEIETLKDKLDSILDDDTE